MRFELLEEKYYHLFSSICNNLGCFDSSGELLTGLAVNAFKEGVFSIGKYVSDKSFFLFEF